MKVAEILRYFQAQEEAIEALIGQLNEVQVAFNARYDAFKAQHDATLDELTDTLGANLELLNPSLRAEIEERLTTERTIIEERCQKLREEYLPKRQAAADELLRQAQAELADFRVLNPQLDQQEEELKAEKEGLVAQLQALNDQIRKTSGGLGLVVNFLSIIRADRERHRILGKLEALNESLHQVRSQWDKERARVNQRQAALQGRWQMESIAAARLQSELDQMDNPDKSQELALQRAIRHVLDNLKVPTPGSDAAINERLQDMIQLNIHTDEYHAGLASSGGLIGLLGGIQKGMQAMRASIEALKSEQEMHSAHLPALDLKLPKEAEAFHRQWPALTKEFSDEKTIGADPSTFQARVEPLLTGPLSERSIEALFASLNAMIQQATARW
jgi:hypothetical protein